MILCNVFLRCSSAGVSRVQFSYLPLHYWYFLSFRLRRELVTDKCMRAIDVGCMYQFSESITLGFMNSALVLADMDTAWFVLPSLVLSTAVNLISYRNWPAWCF